MKKTPWDDPPPHLLLSAFPHRIAAARMLSIHNETAHGSNALQRSL
jgi:hypothetical protein